jgi:hypothetical protein
MRLAPLLGGVLLLFVAATVVLAEPEPVPREAVVQTAEVEVRSGPGNEFYATSKLRRGDKVLVMHDNENGWAAIKPPAESFSWIDVRQVQKLAAPPYPQGTVVVMAAEALVRVGSRLYNQAPSVTRIKVPRGTQLTAMGDAKPAADGVWLPILPAPQEVRYIPANALTAALTTGTGTAPPPLASEAPPLVSKPDPSPVVLATQASQKTTLLTQAEQAEKAGNLVLAKELYAKLKKEVEGKDPTLAVQCMNRIELIDKRLNAPSAANPPAANNGGRASVQPASASTYPGSTTPVLPAGGSQYTYESTSPGTVRLTSPVAAASPAAGPRANWYGPGKVYRAPFALEKGRTLYGFHALTPQGHWHIYVLAGPNVNLDMWQEKPVVLYGTPVHEQRLGYVMTVLDARPPQ